MTFSAQWQSEQNKFLASMAFRNLDSKGFFNSVYNSVRKQSFFRTSEKKELRGVSGNLITKTKIKNGVAYEAAIRSSASEHVKISIANAEANRALLLTDKELRVGDLNLSWDDDSLKNWAQEKADTCSELASGAVYEIVSIGLDKFGIERFKKVLQGIFPNTGYMQVGLYFIEKGFGDQLPMPCIYKYGIDAAVARCCDRSWWLRKARVLKARKIDQVARGFRMVHAKAQPYASNEAVNLRRKQAKRNRMMLEGFEAVNQEGQAYSLAQLSDLSVSNPTNRRHELMTRISGFETLAGQFGHQGLFVTLTAPAEFHPTRQYKNKKTGRIMRVAEAKNYKGASPRDAQAWLCKTWSQIRAKLHRNNVRVYGFRVAEPHGDGTPHWHFLLFCSKEFVLPIRAAFKNYSLRTHASEKGATQYRVKFVLIDAARGTAAGYIAKYISKSVDGEHICNDLMGNDGRSAAQRICAWASAWGVRQFQQIGGGSVTVWRELRRLDESEGVVEAARSAADAADWAAYCLVQGEGTVFFGRDEQVIRPAKRFDVDIETGELLNEVNKYGESALPKIFGVIANGEYYLTRFFIWTIQRVGQIAKAVTKALPPSNLSADELLDLMRGDGSGSNNREAIALDLCQ